MASTTNPLRCVKINLSDVKAAAPILTNNFQQPTFPPMKTGTLSLLQSAIDQTKKYETNAGKPEEVAPTSRGASLQQIF